MLRANLKRFAPSSESHNGGRGRPRSNFGASSARTGAERSNPPPYWSAHSTSRECLGLWMASLPMWLPSHLHECLQTAEGLVPALRHVVEVAAGDIHLLWL